MKVAIATHKDWSQVSGHAGQAREWLLFHCRPGAPLPDTRFDVTTALCKVRDLFSRH